MKKSLITFFKKNFCNKKIPKSFSDSDFYYSSFIFFIFTRFVAICLSLPAITDVPNYLNDFISGCIYQMNAYRDFSFEYPPLSLLPIYFPAIFRRELNLESYFLIFSSLMFLADFCCLKICQFYCKDRFKLNMREISYMTTLYSLFGLMMFRILYHRLDIVVALFISLSLVFFHAKSKKLEFKFFLNGFLGFFYKIVPVFLIPCGVILKAFSGTSSTKKIFIKIALQLTLFLFVISAAILCLEVYTNNRFVENMMFHEERGVQIESIFGSILIMMSCIFDGIYKINHGYGGWNIESNFYIEFIAKYLGFVVLAAFYAVLFFALIHKKNQGKKIKITDEDFLSASLITIMITLSFQRILSTQFFIWLIPLASIWIAKSRSVKYLIAFSLIFFGAFFIFSIDFFAILWFEPIMSSVLLLRNILLVTATCIITAQFFRKILHD